MRSSRASVSACARCSLTRIKGYERSCIALRRLSGALDHDASHDDLHHGTLADPMIADLLPIREVDDDDTTLG